MGYLFWKGGLPIFGKVGYLFWKDGLPIFGKMGYLFWKGGLPILERWATYFGKVGNNKSSEMFLPNIKLWPNHSQCSMMFYL